jgi:hypothetical protein
MAAPSRQQPLLAYEKRFPRATVWRLEVWPGWVTPRGMSGKGATPSVALDEQTCLLAESRSQSTIAANADTVRDGAESIAGRDAVANPPRRAGVGRDRLWQP